MGWTKGFEPSASGATNRRSNQLSYAHHIFMFFRKERVYHYGKTWGEKNGVK